jgi:hypothetical protein
MQPPFLRAQPWTQPQIAVSVSKVVIAKVTLNTVFLGFLEKQFWLFPFLEVVSTLRSSLRVLRYSVI